MSVGKVRRYDTDTYVKVATWVTGVNFEIESPSRYFFQDYTNINIDMVKTPTASSTSN